MTYAGYGLTLMPKAGARARRRADAQAEQIREGAARLVAERLAQGFPPKVTDPVVLARIAAILRTTDTEASATKSPSFSQRAYQPASTA